MIWHQVNFRSVDTAIPEIYQDRRVLLIKEIVAHSLTTPNESAACNMMVKLGDSVWYSVSQDIV